MYIKTQSLVLRDYQSDDWKRVHRYAADPVFSQFEMWGPNTEADTKKFIADMVLQVSESKNRYKFDLAVCLKNEDLLIGGCGIRRETQESGVANLGWAINPEFQGKGYATEAAASIT